MRPAAWLCSLALLFAGLPRGLAGNSTAGHARRQTDMMYPDSVVAGTFPLGLVMVDGQQSFCPIILVSTTAGVAAASCFDYGQSGQVNAAPYSIATGGQAQPVANRAQITVVAKHPGYDPQSFANNTAVVRFNEIPLPITQKVLEFSHFSSLCLQVS
ncbi:hypothetical protein H4R18_005741 [Coemansia javaensis]|uniref:Uncharacterized protein n=1 Tax=Coemansia javaensis TaxID=2761396 RepID=A0A9W8H294_9FUNG|nr:hypothetical protein H4R18_005741 [Coemansia javaensis]